MNARMQTHRMITIRYGDGNLEQTAAEHLRSALRNIGITRAIAWAVRIVREGDQSIDINDTRVKGLQIINPTAMNIERKI